MNNKYNLISAILYFVCAAVLAGIAVFYFVKGNTASGAIFIVVAALCILYAVFKIFKYRKSKEEPKQEEPKDKRGFL